MHKTMLASTALLLLSCASPKAPITGSWLQPVPGQPGSTQGIRLLPGGRAESVNMSTLVYEEWERDGNTLTLRGKSLGNRTSAPFTFKASVDKLTDHTLVLTIDGQKDAFTRAKP